MTGARDGGRRRSSSARPPAARAVTLPPTPAVPRSPRAAVRGALRAVAAPPDAALLEAGRQGERVLARIRLALFVGLLAVPLSWTVVGGQERWEVAMGVAIAVAAVLVAALLDWAARGDRLPRWFGLVSGPLDVTLVSAALAAFLAVDQPLTTVNSTIVFDLYFLGLFATALRHDWRACALAGLAAVAQYVGLAAWASAGWDLADANWVGSGYGFFRWSTVVGRALLLALASALTALLVVRTARLRLAAVRDRLTGVANRAYFDERLADELARAARADAPLAVALLDVDRFKPLNDTHGHLAGDAVLRAVAAALQGALAPTETLARYGGEEFGVLLPGASGAAATARMRALCAAVAAVRVPWPPPGAAPASGAAHAPRVLRVTASGGVAERHADGAGDLLPLLALADERLYWAKDAGRDAVVGPGDGRGAPRATDPAGQRAVRAPRAPARREPAHRAAGRA